MARKRTRRTKLSDQLRQAVENCGISRYKISLDTDIDQGALSHFVAGNRGLSLDTLDVLADYLDINLTTTKPRKRSK